MPIMGDLAKSLMEPTDIRTVFIGWDAAKGKDKRRQELCARIRSDVNTTLRYKRFCIMRHQSFWRLMSATEEVLEALAGDIVKWERLHRDGDSRWWKETKLKMMTRRRARQLNMKVPRGTKEIPNPFYNSTEKPDCHADYRIFPMGESQTGQKFGTALEMETMLKWANSIIESCIKIRKLGSTTRQLQNSLKRKLEGLFEFIKEYANTVPRHKELMDDLMVADDQVRETETFVTKKN